MKVALIKTELGFLPAYDSDKVKTDKIAIGEIREYDTKENRNLKHHRKFFALMRLALELLPEDKNKQAFDFGFSFKTEDDVLFYVKMKLGYYTERMVLKSGKVAIVPDSISFEKMAQDEFSDFYSKAIDVIINLVDADREVLENELAGYM